MSESKKWYQRWYVWLIVLAILGSLFGDDDKENVTQTDQDSTEQINDSQKEQSEAIEVKSSVLYKAYDENEVSADNEYKDKWLKITGKVIDVRNNSIKKSETIVKLNGLIDNEYEIIGVSCHFDESHKDEIAKISKGQTITILGKCVGKPVFIKIEECSITSSNNSIANDQNSSNSEISVSNKSVTSSTSDKKAPVAKKKKTRPDCESYSIRNAFMLGMEAFAAGTSIDFCSNEIILDGKSYDAELGFINTSSVRYYFNTSWAGEVELLVNFTTNSCIMRMRYEVTERADFRISKSVSSDTDEEAAAE